MCQDVALAYVRFLWSGCCQMCCCVMTFCENSDSVVCSSVQEYACLAAQDGFWLGTLFYHWASALVGVETRDEEDTLPLYNYVLHKSTVAWGHTDMLGNIHRVHPFIKLSAIVLPLQHCL